MNIEMQDDSLTFDNLHRFQHQFISVASIKNSSQFNQQPIDSSRLNKKSRPKSGRLNFFPIILDHIFRKELKNFMNQFQIQMQSKTSSGIFLNDTKSNPVSTKKSYSSILNQIIEKSTGRILTDSESWNAAKSIYNSDNDEYIRAVQTQIKLGAEIQDDIDRDSMTMLDYKNYIDAKIKSLPLDYSNQNDTETINISEDGWNRMKSDENYEAWVLGYLRQDFAVHNPYYDRGNFKGLYIVENFGASVDEHYSSATMKTDSIELPNEDVENATNALKKAQKKLDEMYVERRRKRRKALQELEQKKYLQRRQIAQVDIEIAQMRREQNYVDLSRIRFDSPSMVSASLILAVSI